VRYAHTPLLVDAHGERLAKRRGDETVRALRDRNESAGAIRARLARAIGHDTDDVDFDALCAWLDDGVLSRATITLA
jgi:hypothetical protein